MPLPCSFTSLGLPTHADPVAWTLENRGAILSALYTLLLGNPQLQPERAREQKTRFKTWWHLVGSAIENAVMALQVQQLTSVESARYASPIDFGKVFADVEADDEDGTVLSDVLDIMHHMWPGRAFQASDVAKVVNEPLEGEADASSILRGFIEADGRRPGLTITPKAVGRRLVAVSDSPVYVGGRVMKLVRRTPSKSAPRKSALFFEVRVMP